MGYHSFSTTTAADDGFWHGTTFDNSNTEVLMGDVGTGNPWNGFFRFPGVTVPKGETVVDAFLYFYAGAGTPAGTKLTIQAEDVDTAVAPTSAAEGDALTLTTASVAWENMQGYTNNYRHRSPNIKTVIQEILDRGSWASGNAMMLVIKENGSTTGNYITADSNGGFMDPILVIETETLVGSEVNDFESAWYIDNGYRTDSGTWYEWLAYSSVGDQGNQDTDAFLRFVNCQIPNGATIDVAYFSVQAKASTGTLANIVTNIYADAQDWAPAPTYKTDYDNRTTTTAVVAWDSPAAWVAETIYNSPSITTVIQEIVDRTGWISGGPILILWKDDGTPTSNYLDFYTDPIGAKTTPVLHVEWTEAGGGTGVANFFLGVG